MMRLMNFLRPGRRRRYRMGELERVIGQFERMRRRIEHAAFAMEEQKIENERQIDSLIATNRGLKREVQRADNIYAALAAFIGESVS